MGESSFLFSKLSSSFQKACVNLHSQNKCRGFSTSSSQNLHTSVCIFPILHKKTVGGYFSFGLNATLHYALLTRLNTLVFRIICDTSCLCEMYIQ